MKAFILLLTGVVVMSVVVNPRAVPAAPPDDADSWSKPTRGLQARITFVEKPKSNGTRSIVPYLELQNVSGSAYPLKVRCDTGHVKFELVDAEGKVIPIRGPSGLSRDGHHPDPGTIVLPLDSSMRISMYCNNWGVPKDAAAMISTDSGAWVLKQQEKGKVFLRATIEGAKVESDPDRMWYGTIVIPAAKVDWKEAEKKDMDELEEKSLTPETIVAKKFEGKATVEFTVGDEGTGGIQGGSLKYGGVSGIYLCPSGKLKGDDRVRVRISTLSEPSIDRLKARHQSTAMLSWNRL